MAMKLLSILLVCAALGGGAAVMGADAQAVRDPPPDSAPPLGAPSLAPAGRSVAARSELVAFKKSIRALYDLKERRLGGWGRRDHRDEVLCRGRRIGRRG